MIKSVESKSSAYTTRVTEARPTLQSWLMGTPTPTSPFSPSVWACSLQISTYLSLNCLSLKERSGCCSELANSPLCLIMRDLTLSGSTNLSSFYRSAKGGLFFSEPSIQWCRKKKRAKAESDISLVFFKLRLRQNIHFDSVQRVRNTSHALDSHAQLPLHEMKDGSVNSSARIGGLLTTELHLELNTLEMATLKYCTVCTR